MGFPGGSDGKEAICNAEGQALIPGLGRSPGEGNDYPLQYSCWEIAWTEEVGGLQPMGSQRDTTKRQNVSTNVLMLRRNRVVLGRHLR